MVEVHDGIEQVRVFEASEPYGPDADNPIRCAFWRQAMAELRLDPNNEWYAEINFDDMHGGDGTLTIRFGSSPHDGPPDYAKESIANAMRACLRLLADVAA